MKIPVLIFVLALIHGFAFSQVNREAFSDDEKQLEILLKSFAEAYAKVGQTKDAKTVLAHMHPKVSATLVSANVNQSIKVIESDYEGFKSYIASIIRAEGVQIDYKLTDILRVYARGTIGVVAYVVEYTNKKDGAIWAKGSETVTLTFKKIDDAWKIIHYTVVSVEDEKNRGACLCEIFAGGSNDYVVKTTVPAGRSYETSLNNFEFRTAPVNAHQIRVGDATYHWQASGELWRTDAKGERTTKMGRAVNHNEVIMAVVRQDLFAENCAQIKVKE
ncbi:MAG: nuclear transport factor 2 family protein [Bernardetiaceae bacterium]